MIPITVSVMSNIINYLYEVHLVTKKLPFVLMGDCKLNVFETPCWSKTYVWQAVGCWLLL